MVFSLDRDNISGELSNDKQYNYVLKTLLLEPGVSELKQLTLSLNLSSIHMKKTSEQFSAIESLTFYSISIKIMDSYIQVFLNESRRFVQNSTRQRLGGSGFHTIAEGLTTISNCPYVDHGNDSYTIYCPLHENCVTIVSHLLYFDYFSYAANIDRYPANKLIFRKKLCGTINLTFPQGILHWSKKTVSSNDTQPTLKVFPWHLKFNNNDLIFYTQLLQCLQLSNKSLYFIGDSHCRYIAFHALRILGKKIGSLKSKGAFTVENIHYFFAPYAREYVLPVLRSLLTSLLVNNSQAAIVFDVGSWEVHFGNISYFATLIIPAIRSAMIDMQRDGLFDKIKVVFFDIPPVPLSKRGASPRRNLMALAAANRLLADAMKNIDIKYVDYFALSRIFVNHSAPNNNHYLAVDNNSSYGDVGIEIANYILQLICD